MRKLAFALMLVAGTANAENVVRVEASGSAAEVMDRLEAAVSGAGATVFARVDHGGGAESAGMSLMPSEVLIFGNPKLGTPAMQADPVAGLHLPLKMLVYEDGEGSTWVVYEDVAQTFDGLDIPSDAAVLATMSGVLQRFAAAAAGN